MSAWREVWSGVRARLGDILYWMFLGGVAVVGVMVGRAAIGYLVAG